LREKIGIIGIWDDHDYGMNDGDARNPIKIPQKQIFLDYLDEPKDS
jgi:alkaline phosphatase D